MKDDIKSIIDLAVTAPSGDNSQPWRFKVKDNVIEVINIPEADRSLYNFKQNASMVANGCLIENIVIASSHFGYKADIKLLPGSSDPNTVAFITLNKSDVSEDGLFKFIKKRSSNRKAYSAEALKEEEKRELERTEIPTEVNIRFKSGEDRDTLAKILAINEKLVLENKNLHSFLFSHITWSKEEDAKRPGFFIDTFELKSHQRAAFSLFKNWSILNFFNKIGASNLISNDNAKLYRSSGDIGAIIVPHNGSIDYLQTGRLFLRLWLKASKMDLGIQPLTGISFLNERVKAGSDVKLTKMHQDLIKEAYGEMENIFDASGKIISMVFRIGYVNAPSARTRRKEPEITFV